MKAEEVGGIELGNGYMSIGGGQSVIRMAEQEMPQKKRKIPYGTMIGRFDIKRLRV